MARFKIVTTAGPSTDYSLEMEALAAFLSNLRPPGTVPAMAAGDPPKN